MKYSPHLYLIRIPGLILALCFLLTFNAVSNSNQIDTVRYTSYYKKAEAAKQKREFKKSIDLYQLALANSDNLLKKLIVNQKIAGMFLVLGKVDSAEYWAQKNLSIDRSLIESNELKTEIARTYSIMRSSGNIKGDYKQVEQALGKGIEILNEIKISNMLLCHFYIDMGINYWRMGNYEDAILWCKKAIKTVPKLNEAESRTIQIRTSITLGLVYWNKRNLQTAVGYYKQVFRLIGADVKENARDFAITCNNLGIIYTEREHYDSANIYYRYAISNLDNIGVEFADQALNYKSTFMNSMGINYTGLGNYEQAEACHRKALEWRVMLSGESHPEAARIFLNLGRACFMQKKFKEAQSYLFKSLKIRMSTPGISKVEISKTYNALGDLYYENADFKNSMKYFDSALFINPKITLGKEVLYADVRESCYSFSGKMKNLVSERKIKTEQVAEIETLFSDVKTQMNYALTRTSDPILKKDVQLLFNDLFEIYYQLHQQSNERKYLNRLWEISEYKKGFKLNAQLNNQIAINTTLPEDLIQKERSIKDSLILLTESKFENKNVDSALFVYRRKYDDFIENLEADYPNFYALKYSIIQTSLDEAQSTLREGKISANFFETKKNMFTICLSKHTAEISKHDINELDSLTKNMNSSIATNDTLKIHLFAFALRQALFPVSINFRKIKTLEVLPDGKAWTIHFSMLSDKIGPDGEIDYIGKYVNISYQYSFDHLALTQKGKKKNNSKILAFSFSGKPISETNLSYVKFRDLESDLPGTSIEINQISKNWDGDYYFAASASESKFKEKYKNYQIIHLALHGLLDDQYPAYSKLKFASPDTINDGLLYAYEIYGLDINAELVVLSACNSGLGKIENGEGIESLGRAFAFAGANSLLLSKWEVSDVTTPVIMNYFYEGLKEGLTKSEALRLAKMKFLKYDADNITSSPYFWDSFYVLGEDSPIKKNAWKQNIFGVVGGIIFVSLFFLCLYKVRMKKIT